MTQGPVIPSKLSEDRWRDLAKKAELDPEDWGEGWLALHAAGEGGEIDEEMAIACLREVSGAAAAPIRFHREVNLGHLEEAVA